MFLYTIQVILKTTHARYRAHSYEAAVHGGLKVEFRLHMAEIAREACSHKASEVAHL